MSAVEWIGDGWSTQRAGYRGLLREPARYFVLTRDGAWLIRYRSDLYGPYLNQREALLFAIDAAHGIGRRVGHSEVLIEGEPGHFHAAWTFGDDPSPPTG